MSLIEINGLEKYYNRKKASEVHALRNVSFSVEQGEMLAVMGVSGSGKSTLLNILGFMDGFDAGTYLFDGRDVSSFNDKKLAGLRNRSVGFVMQSFGLILTQTAIENVSLPMLLDPGSKYGGIKDRCMRLLNEVGIADKARSPVEELSGGQQQRVAIARAMANDPKLIIADEPTAALDSETTAEIMELFTKMNRERGTTVLLATHDTLAAQYCGRVLRIKDGTIAG